jgi:hypothetical protein
VSFVTTFECLQERLDLSLPKERENLTQLFQFAPLGRVILNVFAEKAEVVFAIQSLLARVFPFLAGKLVILPGKHELPATFLFDEAEVNEPLRSGDESLRDSLLSLDGAQDQPIVRPELRGCLLADLLHEADEIRVLHLAKERQAHLILVGTGEVRDGFPVADGLFIDQVHSLA